MEFKTTRQLAEMYYARCRKYLQATGLSICCLVNFGKPQGEVKRSVNDF